jgi:hypothetical protein
MQTPVRMQTAPQALCSCTLIAPLLTRYTQFWTRWWTRYFSSGGVYYWLDSDLPFRRSSDTFASGHENGCELACLLVRFGTHPRMCHTGQHCRVIYARSKAPSGHSRAREIIAREKTAEKEIFPGPCSLVTWLRSGVAGGVERSPRSGLPRRLRRQKPRSLGSKNPFILTRHL